MYHPMDLCLNFTETKLSESATVHVCAALAGVLNILVLVNAETTNRAWFSLALPASFNFLPLILISGDFWVAKLMTKMTLVVRDCPSSCLPRTLALLLTGHALMEQCRGILTVIYGKRCRASPRAARVNDKSWRHYTFLIFFLGR